MKKRILYGVLGLVTVVVIAAAAAPMVIGRGVRDATMNSLLEMLPPESRSQLVITETRFDSGWFSSEGELDLRYVALADDDDLAMRLLFDISHGPLLFTPDGVRLGLAYAEIIPSFTSAELTQAMTDLPIELPDVRMDLLAGLDQSLLISLNIEPFNYSNESAQVSFAGMRGSILTNPDLSAEILFNMGQLQAAQPTTQMGFNLAGMTLESTTQQVNDLLAPSMAMLAIPAISSEAPYPFNISNIRADASVQPSGAGPERIDIRQGFRVASIDADIPVTSVNLTMDLSELHSELVRGYYEMIAEIQNAINTNPQTGTSTIEESAEAMAMIAIQNSLVFGYLVEANAFDGDHSINLRIDWRGMPGVTDLDSIEAMQILEVLSFDVSVSLDEAAIMRSPMAEMVDPYVQQGYLRIDGGRILMDMSLRDAELTVNGETVALEQFL
ncbi:MAG: DUF945 family protein [Proteobacteria bacterium]|nr:DUF945 family protein [Pseudomonadota bacterium]MDA0928035.1 DUF945 family protein [Pseudomonadota bacterium]